MSSDPHLRVLHAARLVVDDVNRLVRVKRIRRAGQLLEAAESIPANIKEALGREKGPDRNKFYVYARGSAEETNERLRARWADGQVPDKDYWRIHNRLVTIVRMLDSLIASGR